MTDDVIIGVDAGTSIIKAVAFDTVGTQLAYASRPNSYRHVAGGGVEQDAAQTWCETAATLRDLTEQLDNLAGRTVCVSITGQGDGTWLIDSEGEPVMPSWLWLDTRSADIVQRWRAEGVASLMWRIGGLGVSPANQSGHLKWLQQHRPEVLEQADVAFHCKDWLYFKLTGERATDQTEALLSFGDIRTGEYSDELLTATGLAEYKRLLPAIINGCRHYAPLTAGASGETGLKQGTPVILAPMDAQCSGLGGGIYSGSESVGCSALGSTGGHMRCVPNLDSLAMDDDVARDAVGYLFPFAKPGTWMQFVSNMSATLNIDWFINTLHEFATLIDAGHGRTPEQLLSVLDEQVGRAEPARAIYHPFIHPAGERGPFAEPAARAQFLGLHTGISIVDMLRAIYEAIGFATRDCYQYMGALPDEIRLTGGFARSATCSRILASIVDRPVRSVNRDETGAAGAAIVAGLTLGLYPDLDSAVADWVTPFLGERRAPDRQLAGQYSAMFDVYREGYRHMTPFWHALQAQHRGAGA